MFSVAIYVYVHLSFYTIVHSRVLSIRYLVAFQSNILSVTLLSNDWRIDCYSFTYYMVYTIHYLEILFLVAVDFISLNIPLSHSTVLTPFIFAA